MSEGLDDAKHGDGQDQRETAETFQHEMLLLAVIHRRIGGEQAGNASKPRPVIQ